MFLRNVEASKSEKVLLTTHYVGPKTNSLSFTGQLLRRCGLRALWALNPKP